MFIIVCYDLTIQKSLQRYKKKMTYASVCHSFHDFFRFLPLALAVELVNKVR